MDAVMGHYAVVINLSGEMLKEALRGWALLREDFGIKQISLEAECPHITISSGNHQAPDILIHHLEGIAKTFRPFGVHGNGLGVFAGETPVVYIRWLLTEDLANLYGHCEGLLGNAWRNPSDNTRPERWQPKATLACHDIAYEQLGPALVELRKMNFERPMRADGLTLAEITREGERTVKKVCFQA